MSTPPASLPALPSPSRRNLLRRTAALSLLASLANACRIKTPLPPRSKRPNIIYMHSHDSGRLVSPYGAEVETPHLAKFAAAGVTFKQAFAASPTCSPSRASLLTGMTPGTNGMWGLAHKGWRLNNYAQSMVQTLRRTGYTTALSGIQHIASASTPEEAARLIGYDTPIASRGATAQSIAEAAVDYLENLGRTPFFLDIGFGETHRFPLNDRGSYFRYDAGKPGAVPVPQPLSNALEHQRDLADIGVAFTNLDAAMGLVLEALERLDLAQNTLVIITTDHGLPFPGMKSYHTDGGLGVMLMMRGPKGFSGGKEIGSLVSNIDVFPTVCDVLELQKPAWLQGQSLMPLVKGTQKEVNEAVFAEYQDHAVREPQASVRTHTHKYIRRLSGDPTPKPRNVDETYSKTLWLQEGGGRRPRALEELYDLVSDPYEQHNLAADPAAAKTLSEMRRRLVAHMEKWHNPLLYKYAVADAPPTYFVEGPSDGAASHRTQIDKAASEIGMIVTAEP